MKIDKIYLKKVFFPTFLKSNKAEIIFSDAFAHVKSHTPEMDKLIYHADILLKEGIIDSNGNDIWLHWQGDKAPFDTKISLTLKGLRFAETLE